MTRILRLLLIVAIALPMWQPAVAQNATGADPVMANAKNPVDAICKARKIGEAHAVIMPRENVPNGYARVILAVGTGWTSQNGNSFGYQMLLDEDATIYSSVSNYAIINQQGYNVNYLNYNSTADNIYGSCEYTIPENPEVAAYTQNAIFNNQGSVLIPAGTYDYAITALGPYIYFGSNYGDVNGRGNDYQFESGKTYVFNVVGTTVNGREYDAIYLEISQPYMAMIVGDGDFGNVQIGEAASTTITVMNTGEDTFTPVIACDNPAFTITYPSNGNEPLTGGASRNYVVTFVPTELESYNGTFTLTAVEEEAAFDINYTKQLSGNGVGEGHQGDPSGGDNQNQMFPIYTNQARYGTSSQMIYPASMLEAQGIKTGDVINSLTFYVQNNGTVNNNINLLNVTLRLGKTAATTVTSVNAMTTNRNNCTQVFSGTLTGGQNTLTVTLTTPYQYQGDNLIVDFDSEINNNSNYNFQTNWAGENGHTNASYNAYYRNYYSTNTTNTQGNFLPEVSIGYTTMPELEATTAIDFETVKVGFGNSKTAIIKNLGSEDVQATLTVSDNPPFSVANSTITIGANSFAIIPVTFMPNAEGNFNGTLTVVAGSETTTISLTGKGILTGPETILDPSYYDDENNGYTWPLENVTVDNVTTEADSKFSKLNEIATDPDQIIALLRKVYMDRNIPGNYYRGYTSTGGEDHDNVVPYTGVGRITSSTATECENSYGWKIPGTVKNGDSYRYLDPEQYKPYKEGVTLLLIEMQDKFKKSDVFPSDATNSEHNYTNLRKYIGAAIKSARIVTEARRSGEGMERGTMFKIDCDHMNKFYLIAKGQLLWFDNQKYEANNANIGYQNPVYYNSTYYDHNLEKSYLNGPALLCHMYEQFSPVQGGAEAGMNDIYRLLVTDMESFGVVHDCPNVPYVQNGHHSMMYGEDSESHDCQDVRDMMFFVPDYRMTDHFNRGSGGYLSEYRTQDYFRYNTKRQPTIGMFVIKQFEIPEGSKDLTYTKDAYDEITEDEDGNEITIHHEAVTGLYQHKLSWKSNLDDFLPSYMQEYELWEIVVDDFGIEKYQPVYYRNASGAYTDAQGATVTTPVPIILQRKDLTEFEYTDVFVDMHEGSQTKTYVIRGRDAADAEGKHFMSLQMSNPEETIIPGTDPREKARMISATYYSRYNPDNEMNCYSNKLELTNNGITLTEDELVGKTIQFCRSSRAAQVDEVTGEVKTDAQGNILYEETANDVVFATATASATQNITIGTGNNSVRIPSGTITVTIANGTQGSKDDYPVGKSDENTTGYHPNENLSFTYTLDENDYVRFYTVVNNKVQYTSIGFWDNFTVEVDKNAHPFQYLYRMEIKASATATDPDAYTNNARVPVYKTDSQINSYTLNQVNADVDGDLTLEDSEFDVKVQYSSKGGILRYDSYRWKSTEARYIVDEVENNGDDEEEIAPTGQAGNQVEYYTVNMNKDNEPDYYVADQEHQPKVTATNPTAWATFVDYHLRMNPDNQEYVYAPVVELFTNGYKQYLDENDKLIKRTDYNTYGGPMKKYANGKLEVETVVPKDANGNNAVMTDYSWLGTDGNEYAYYTLNLNLKTRQVPESYQFYKVRAWHQVLDMNNNPKPEYLDEQYEALNYRKGNAQGKYKFEEITYPACNADASLGTWDPTELGAEQDPKSVGFTDDNGKPLNFTAGTFGARKIGVGNTEDFKIRYYVRIYFTLEDNMPSTTTNTTGVHIKDETADNSGGVFYIVEGYTDYVVNTSIPTSIKVFDSREVVGVKYYNVAGIESDTPFQGVNIVVTRYNDGSTTTTKIIK